MSSNPNSDDSDDFSVLIIGTETSGSKRDGGKIIELGAVLYSVRHKCVLSQISSILPPETPHFAGAGVKGAVPTLAVGTSMENATSECNLIVSWASKSTFVVSHDAEMHRQWFRESELLAPLCDKDWLCTCYDFPWPRQRHAGMTLFAVALAHDVVVECAHRALTDCLLIASLLSAMGDDLPYMIRQAARPKGRVVVKVSEGGTVAAREAGFTWNLDTKQWTRWIALGDLHTLSLRYRVAEVEPRGNESVVWAKLWLMYVYRKVGKGVDTERYSNFGDDVWKAIMNFEAMRSAVQRLWDQSERGSTDPHGLMETLGAIEGWYRGTHRDMGGDVDSPKESIACDEQGASQAEIISIGLSDLSLGSLPSESDDPSNPEVASARDTT